jgi:uncharacterized coiled-coil protein SlyX
MARILRSFLVHCMNAIDPQRKVIEELQAMIGEMDRTIRIARRSLADLTRSLDGRQEDDWETSTEDFTERPSYIPELERFL